MSVETFIERFTESGVGFFTAHMQRWDLAIKAIEAIGDSIKHGECWCYPHTAPDSYSRIRVKGKNTTASRLVLCVGTNKPLSYKMDACHKTPLCRFKNCINPDHLYWETHAENCRRRELERRARAAIAPLAGDLVSA
ncbi:MAG: hypothetical protein ACLPHP_05230 [Candidatus Sulfotelmatobacter sp.]